MADGTKGAWNFGSDNVAPIAPDIMAAMVAANTGNISSYGADPWTSRLTQRLRDIFETELVAFPVATGTAANALALSVLVPPYGGVLCAEVAHINTDECGAPEFFTGGAKLVGLPAPDGRIAPAQLTGPVEHARALGVHYVQPAAVSITQSTEWGAVYMVRRRSRPWARRRMRLGCCCIWMAPASPMRWCISAARRRR